MKKIITLFVLLLGLIAQAQNTKTIEYIQLKRQYDFQDAANQYRLSSMLKYHFEEMGYKVYYKEDGMPVDVRSNRCKELICDVDKSGKLTVTELTITLKNCNDEVIASGKGLSRSKDRKQTYKEVVSYIFKNTLVGKFVTR